MAQPTVTTLLADAAKQLRADFEYVRRTNPHAGEKGEEVEQILKTFLNRHMPQRFRAGSGIIIDEENNLSRQTDVVVYDCLSSPLYRAADKTQIIPSQAVAAVIEVKSSLNKKELGDAFEKVASCKRLKKRPLSEMDLETTKTGLSTTGTMGVVFAFDAETSLEALAENTKEFNADYDSSLWPDLVVVLDKGVLAYAISWPGQQGMAGSFGSQPAPGTQPKYSPPPWYVHLVIHRDGELTLNRFFLLLLSQLTFYPFRYAGAPFKTFLEGADPTVMTVTAYQFNKAAQLKPAPKELYFSNNPPKPLSMKILAPDGEQLALLQFFKWQDGSVVRSFGKLPLEGILPLLVADPLALALHDPSTPGMQISSLLSVTEEEFRDWPTALAQRSNLKGVIEK